MTREEFKEFRDEVLRKRFYWCNSVAERKYLTEKGYKYLFRCTHYKTDRYFWVFDLSDELMKDVEIWKSEHKKPTKKEVSETVTEL